MNKNELDHAAVRQHVKSLEDYFKIDVAFSRNVRRYGTEGGEQESSDWQASWC